MYPNNPTTEAPMAAEDYYIHDKSGTAGLRHVRYVFVLAMVLGAAVGAAIAAIHTDWTKNISTMAQGHRKLEAKEQPQHCVVHVHGLHHSGTGFLRSTIHTALVQGGIMASQHENTKAIEDEGQHLQTVYPSFGERTKGGNQQNVEFCGKDAFDETDQHPDKGRLPKIGRSYYCLKLVDTIAQDDQKKQKLFDQWAQYWDMSNPVLIQKTPSLDVVFLEQMKLTPTVHLMVVRHPMMWYAPVLVGHAQQPIQHALVWLKVWTQVLEQLADQQVESFAVVNYDLLVLEPDAIRQELLGLVEDTCPDVRQWPSSQKDNPNAQRSLHLHKGKNQTKYLMPKREDLPLWAHCQHDKTCRDLMEDLGPVLTEFGFNTEWTQTDKLYVGQGDNRPQKVLFSPKRLPSKELIRTMKDLVHKYIYYD